jgi:hypothetical protein
LSESPVPTLNFLRLISAPSADTVRWLECACLARFHNAFERTGQSFILSFARLITRDTRLGVIKGLEEQTKDELSASSSFIIERRKRTLILRRVLLLLPSYADCGFLSISPSPPFDSMSFSIFKTWSRLSACVCLTSCTSGHACEPEGPKRAWSDARRSSKGRLPSDGISNT